MISVRSLGTVLPPVGGASATIYKLQGAGPPVDGVTGVGIVNTGELYLDTTAPNAYMNVGTAAVPAYSGIART